MNFISDENWNSFSFLKESKVNWIKNPKNNQHILYVAKIDGADWKIRLNNFPEEPMYTLNIDQKNVLHFNDWPKNWRKPA